MNFKIRLLLGVAAPFVCGLAATAYGQEITTALTTPVSTSTIANGAPANINITSTGSVTIAGQASATAVTIDSNNTVTNAGSISVTDSDNAIGVRIAPNLTTGYTGNGAITVIEDYTRTDADSDGDLDGALAKGTGRYGLLLSPGGTMTGDIKLPIAAGSITVEGNNSSGISLQSILNGNYSQTGAAITVIGSNTFGLDMQQNVTGNVWLNGTISATGQNATAVRSLGDVGGEFAIGGVLFSTGFTSTDSLDTNYVDPDTLATDGTPIEKRLDADDLLNGGPALLIRGNLAKGFLINGAATGTVDTTTDVKDAIQNFNENRLTGSVAAYGSSPAVLIRPEDGAAGRNVTLSKITESVQDTLDDDDDDDITEIIATFNYDVGFLNRGRITANGFNVGGITVEGVAIPEFPATALYIAGSADGTHTTTIEGGLQNTGAIEATAYEANATAIRLGAGMSTPALINSGSIKATVLTEATDAAAAIVIEAGANVGSVTNSGNMQAGVRGYDGDAVAFRDLSGTVTSFTNSSRVLAFHDDDDATDTITSGLGRDIAIDLSHTAAATTLTQNDIIDNARIFGDVLFGSGNDLFNLQSGIVTGDVDFGAGSNTFNVTSATMVGDAVFKGAGATVALNQGLMAGDLNFGNAAGSLSLINDSTYSGAITTGATSAISATVNNSTLYHSGDATARFTSLSATNGSEIQFAINNARINGGLPVYNVVGTADIAAGTVFRPVFTEFTNRTFTLHLLNAGTLNVGGDLNSMLAADVPYLYNVSLSRTGNMIDAAMRVKTVGELGLKTYQFGTYDAVLDLLAADSDFGSVVTNLSSGDDFRNAYANLLPVSDAALLNVLAANSNAAFGATARRLDLVTEKPLGAGGAWLEEFGVVRTEDESADQLETSGGGFGVSGGLDLISSRNRVLGAYFSFENLKFEDDIRTQSPLNSTQYTLGGYGGWKHGNLAINGAAGVGWVGFRSKRSVTLGTFTDQLADEWSGMSLNAGGRASYNIPLGFLAVRPYVSADYMSVSQNAHSERSLNATDLAVTYDKGDSSLATASYGAVFAAELGGDPTFSIRPEVTVGWRQVLDYKANDGTARFVNRTTPFSFSSGVDPQDALVAGVGLHVNSEFLNIKVGYDTEISDTAETHYGSITLRMTFW